MGDLRPPDIDTDGDEGVLSPRSLESSLLAAERGTNKTRRIEVDANGDLHVVLSAGAITIAEPVSVDDNGGSLTVDGTVNVGNFPTVQPVSDNGSSLTVDGTVNVSNAFLLDATFTGRINTQGQKAMAGSTPVVIASDQSAVPVSGTVAVSTALLLDATFTNRINTQGQKTMSGSTPVVLASDQSVLNVVAFPGIVDLGADAPTAATIGTSSATAVASNANRRGLTLRNVSTSGQRISLAFDGGTAVLNSGVTLDPGDVFSMAGHDFTNGAVAAISSAASGSLAIQEWTT